VTVSSITPRAADDRARLAMAVAASPRDPALRRALAATLAKAGEAKAALDQYRAVLALLPNDPDAAADAGLMARRCGLDEEVLPVVRAAAAAHPGHAKLWQVLGLMHRARDEHETATEALDRAAALAPGDALIAHARARSWFEAGKQSSSYYEQARKLAPADKNLLLGYGAALIAEGRSADAIAQLEAELQRDPGWVAGHAALARHLWSMGEHETYTASIERALRAVPRNIDLWKELIAILIHAGAYDQALEAIARGRAAAGPHSMFDANEAVCHAELGDFGKADTMFAALARFGDPTVMLRHVRHLLRSGRPHEAERIARSMIDTPVAKLFFPYLSIAWRLTGNPLWQWLEGDPRLVGVYDLADALPLEALADRLRALHVAVNQPLEQSLRGGTQTDGYLFARTEPEIRALRKAVVEAVQTHVAQLPPPDLRHPQLARRGGPIRFAGSWSVRLTSGGCHANHIHPDGWFSSALYIALPEPAERGPEPAGWLTLGEPQAELHLDLEPFRMIEPKPGRLALFPSTMWHGTRPFAEGERLTVAFDVAPPG
jgi:tetratricopeptide (TPR) repeat protein